MSQATLNGKTLAEWLAMEPCEELDAACHFAAFGDDLKARNDADAITALCQHSRMNSSTTFYFKISEGSEIEAVFANDDMTPYSGLGERDLPTWLWQTREGKPYQAALEAAKEAYRRTPPPYSQDTLEGWWAMQKLTEAMYAHGFDLDVLGRGPEPKHVRFYISKRGVQKNPNEWQSAYTEPLARTRAAIAARFDAITKGGNQ